jgi:hypothetical protein
MVFRELSYGDKFTFHKSMRFGDGPWMRIEPIYIPESPEWSERSIVCVSLVDGGNMSDKECYREWEVTLI